MAISVKPKAALKSAVLVGSMAVVSAARADDQGNAPPPPTETGGVVSDAPEAPTEVVIQGDHEDRDAASRVHVGHRELELRPRLRPADILEAVPGLFAVQHAGGGKANQYFLRGFDADHGTDVAFFVDGVPVNMVSHGHGQGFSDVHFVIPELVVGLEGYKGPYYAAFGDFATAGAVNMRLAEAFQESYAQFSIGQYGILRGLVVESPSLGDGWRAVLAAEVFKDDGPFVNPEDLTRFNLFGRVTRDLGPHSKASITLMSYGSKWNGSGQIPARAVCGEGEPGSPSPESLGQPCIPHFGYVDPSEGGATQRQMLSVSFSTASEDSDLTAMLYVIQYAFTLYSNFTFFAKDPIHGDEIEQDDDRTVGGFDLRIRKHVHFMGAKFTTTGGLQARVDGIDNALHHDEARVRLEDRISSRIGESELGIFVEETAALNEHVRFVLGARADRIDVNVDDRLGAASSGIQGATRLSPKWMAIVSPTSKLDLFADYGRGFHSNDARGAVQPTNPARLITPATGYEVGSEFRPIRGLALTAAGFLLDLDSELVWSGDEGTTEAAGATRRYGLELGGRYRIGNWLFADVDATLTHAAYRVNAGDGQAVALAPRRTLTAGIGVRPTFGDFTPFGALRVKSIGDRPATEDGSLVAQGYTLVDANAGLRWKNVELGVDAQNLFNATWREVSFATESRLTYEPAPITGIHYSPGWPRTVMGRLAIYW
jgi:outer membrane receptor protein involved in Fe transport